MVQYKTDDTHLLVSLSSSQGHNFILKMSVVSNVLKLLVTDKLTAERWKCAYDSSYVENLTRKTGNFKEFPVFSSMLKAALLRTNDCVHAELLTQGELEMKRKRARAGRNLRNRKYLILIYRVEFDKIHYPLPLEYCGKPDPEVLQITIRKLENDAKELRSEMTRQLASYKAEVESREAPLQRLVTQLNEENKILYEENRKLKGELAASRNEKLLKKLESQMRYDRSAYEERIYQLEVENRKLSSILSGRASGRRVPARFQGDSVVRRSTSLPRSSSSQVGWRSRRGRKSPSPGRKTSLSSSDRTERATSVKKSTSKTNTDNRTAQRSGSKEKRTSSRERGNSFPKRNGRIRK